MRRSKTRKRIREERVRKGTDLAVDQVIPRNRALSTPRDVVSSVTGAGCPMAMAALRPQFVLEPRRQPLSQIQTVRQVQALKGENKGKGQE